MYTSKKIPEFQNVVDNIDDVLSYNSAVMSMDNALEKIEMNSDDEEGISFWREYHDNACEQAKEVFSRLSVKDISFCSKYYIVWLGDADGGSDFVIIREKRSSTLFS